MADENHLEILRQGVEVWNQWRENNQNIKPELSCTYLERLDLSGANLSDVILINAYLGTANLSGTNLAGAYLSDAHLFRTNLSGANLSGADLSGADLNLSLALTTNFEGANFTGACIGNWNISIKTNFKNVKCDYIYLNHIFSSLEKIWMHNNRRPHDPNKIFAPGEFVQLFQKALETVDLIFSEGIEWAAFLESFQQLQAEVKSEELAIQAIEKKSGGAFVVRLEVPQEANKAEIEKYIRDEYEAKVRVIEANYLKQLQTKDETIQAYREQSTSMFKVVEILSNSQQQINVNVSPNMYNQSGEIGIGHNEKGDISGNGTVAGEINEASQEDKL